MLKKLKSIKINFILGAFLAYLIKLLIITPDYPDALVLACLAGLCGYKVRAQLMEPRKPGANLEKEIQEIKNALSRVNLAKVSENKRHF